MDQLFSSVRGLLQTAFLVAQTGTRDLVNLGIEIKEIITLPLQRGKTNITPDETAREKSCWIRAAISDQRRHLKQTCAAILEPLLKTIPPVDLGPILTDATVAILELIVKHHKADTIPGAVAERWRNWLSPQADRKSVYPSVPASKIATKKAKSTSINLSLFKKSKKKKNTQSSTQSFPAATRDATQVELQSIASPRPESNGFNASSLGSGGKQLYPDESTSPRPQPHGLDTQFAASSFPVSSNKAAASSFPASSSKAAAINPVPSSKAAAINPVPSSREAAINPVPILNKLEALDHSDSRVTLLADGQFAEGLMPTAAVTKTTIVGKKSTENSEKSANSTPMEKKDRVDKSVVKQTLSYQVATAGGVSAALQRRSEHQTKNLRLLDRLKKLFTSSNKSQKSQFVRVVERSSVIVRNPQERRHFWRVFIRPALAPQKSIRTDKNSDSLTKVA